MTANYNLRPLWDAILEIYVAFADICKKHNLRFYATGGTALGAMRHGGFIPWDDDFDLIMPRPDYIKFFEKYYKELPSHLSAEDFRTVPNHTFLHGKVFERRTEVIAKISDSSNLTLEQGIFIDIIPIDGMPKDNIPFYLWAWKRKVWRDYDYRGTLPFWKRLYSTVLGTCFMVPQNNIKRAVAFEKWLSKWNYDNSPAVEDLNANKRRLHDRAFTPETYGEPCWLKFENIEVPLPHDTEIFLSELFGDWRKMPPKEKQIPSHQIRNN